MKKNIKILILFLFSFLFSGCTIEYNLKINKDLTFSEKFVTKIGYGYFEQSKKDVFAARRHCISYINENDPTHLYYFSTFEEDDKFGVKSYTAKNMKLEDLGSMPSIKHLYENVDVKIENDLVSLKTVGDFEVFLVNNLYNVDDLSYYEDEYSVTPDNIYFSITLPFKVEYHNADKVNKETNTFYWYVDENTRKKNIEITFNKSKNHFSFIAQVKKINIGILLFAVIIVIIIILSKNVSLLSQKNNEI